MGYLLIIVAETKEPITIEEKKYKDFYFDETTSNLLDKL